MTATPPAVSLFVPLEQAVRHVRQMLFRPFRLERWFTIGFCAWLANLGQAGGNFNVNLGDRKHQGGLEQVKAFVLENLYWIAPLVVVLVLFGIAAGVILIAQWGPAYDLPSATPTR